MPRKRKNTKELPKELNDYIDATVRSGGLTNMSDIEDFMSSLFGPAIQKILEAEMDSKVDVYNEIDSNKQNYRNGYLPTRTVSGSYGDIDVSVPRDRNADIDSDLIPKYQRTISGFDEKIIAMYAKGSSLSDIREHMKELFGCNLSDDMISDITDKILPDITNWQKRPLDKVYSFIFIDAIHFNVRSNGQVLKKAVYVILGVTSEGKKEVLSITVGENESAKVWMGILSDLKNRGVLDILVICSDGLTGIKEAINAVYPNSDYQRCIVHQIRNSVKFVPHKDKKEVCNDLKEVYTSSTEEQGFNKLVELEEKWKDKYPHAIKSWLDNWDSLSTFFKFTPEIRTIMYTTNAIESLNNRLRTLNRKRVVFPTDTSLLKGIYLAVMDVSKKWTTTYKDWDKIINQLRIQYENRI